MIRTSLYLILITAAPGLAGPQPERDVVETAVSAGSFQTLVAAVKAAGLADALKADGPFTVFAPTDEAFTKLPRGTVTALLKPESRERLQAILSYHVVPGNLRAADLLTRPSLASLDGSALPLSFREGRIRIQQASIVTADIQCANGVIHVIDTVLLPTENGMLDVAKRAGKFQTLLAAIDAAGLRDTLQGEGPFTIFAPTDAAFAQLPNGTVSELLKPANRSKLIAILVGHVVRGRIEAAAALRAGSAKTLSGQTVRVALNDGLLRVGKSTILSPDIKANNGVIHVIDRVILPATPTVSGRQAAKDTLELAIERGVPIYNAGRAGACAAIYEVAMRAVLTMVGPELSPKERSSLENALMKLSRARADTDRAWLLRRAMDQVLASLMVPPPAQTGKAKSAMKETSTFKPLIEAALPVGFPAPGPVGEVALKEYPKYRAARAKGGNSFWTLFNHIKKNEISMTAPVEMAVSENDLKRQNMAFLYGNTSMGKLGSDGRVEVVDIESRRVLSFGIRGPMSDERIEAAKQAIEERLENSKRWTRAGDWRLLGYNSPMVRPDQRFWELQVPVAPAGDSAP
jgi:uncharacterized surface protein with fasciclin (FAS1) repeats